MSSRSSHKSSSSSHKSSGKRSSQRASSQVPQLLDALRTHRINTLAELVRVERTAASGDLTPDEAAAFQEPMTSAWSHYVLESRQFLTELRSLTGSYPFSSSAVDAAESVVRADPGSNRSWNLAWLILVKLRDEGILAEVAAYEAWMPVMWGGRQPEHWEAEQLATCFEAEWREAVMRMLRHWDRREPVWY